MANNPRRGEIWRVDLEPTRGSELQKIHPAVVLSANAIRALPVRVVVPLTGWQDYFSSSPWKIYIAPNTHNNLDKPSAADCLQVRCLSLDRFVERVGIASKDLLAEMIDGINYCLEE